MSRDEDTSHTFDSLIQHFKDTREVDSEDKHVIFIFNTGTTLSIVYTAFPLSEIHGSLICNIFNTIFNLINFLFLLKSHRMDDMEDVAHSIIRLNKLVDINYELENIGPYFLLQNEF
ncbi:hypothetical protein RCL_jg2529.t1 [Rhizophagus clarus]|nr:hypothetical protein RCL_jg2529.t1 [Rhizophagus clarus]